MHKTAAFPLPVENVMYCNVMCCFFTTVPVAFYSARIGDTVHYESDKSVRQIQPAPRFVIDNKMLPYLSNWIRRRNIHQYRYRWGFQVCWCSRRMDCSLRYSQRTHPHLSHTQVIQLTKFVYFVINQSVTHSLTQSINQSIT